MRAPVTVHRTGTWGQVRTRYIEGAFVAALLIVLAIAGAAWVARDDGEEGKRVVFTSSYAAEEAIAAGLRDAGSKGLNFDPKYQLIDGAEAGFYLAEVPAERVDPFTRKMERLEAEGAVLAEPTSSALLDAFNRKMERMEAEGEVLPAIDQGRGRGFVTVD